MTVSFVCHQSLVASVWRTHRKIIWLPLTYQTQNRMAIILHIEFWKAFLWLKIKISLKSVPKGSVDNELALVQVMVWCQRGSKSLPEIMMSKFTDIYTCIWVTGPQWVKQLWLLNTLRPRQNVRHFAADIFKCIFLNEYIWILINTMYFTEVCS